MEKEPRQKRRGLDCETLTTLKAPGPENLTTTTSAHAAQKAVNLLILAVVRLESTLQRVHPLTIRRGKHTRDYTPGSAGRQASLLLRRVWVRPLEPRDISSPQCQDHWGHPLLFTFRASFARLSSNIPVHILTHRLSSNSANLFAITHSFSPHRQEVIQTAPYLFPRLGSHCEYFTPRLLITLPPSAIMGRAARPLSPPGGGRNRLTSFYTQLVDNVVYNVLILPATLAESIQWSS